MATPGLNIKVNDGGLVYANLTSTNASILIIAPNGDTTATQEVDPKRINSEAQFVDAYGDLDSNMPLSKAWYQAVVAGCQDIRLQQLEGNDDATRYENLHLIYRNLEDYEVDAIIVAGVDGDTAPTGVTIDDNQDYCALAGAVIGVSGESLASADGTKKTWTLKGKQTNTLKFIVEGSVTVTVSGTATTAFTMNYITGVITFTTAPAAAAPVLVSYRYYDIVDADRTFMNQLAGFCHFASTRNQVTHGFIALKAAETLTLDGRNTYLNAITAKAIVLSKFVSVIGGPRAKLEWKDGSIYTDSAVAAYGVMAELLPAQSSPTNKKLPGALALEYDLSANQMDKLCTANIVCFRRKSSGVVVTDAMTTAGASSDYTRFTTSKIIKEVINSCRVVAEPYIGEPNTMSQRNALRTAIDSAISAMQTAGALEAYRFNINTGTSGMIDGNVTIDLQIVPVFEIRTISINVSLKTSL